MNKVFAGVFTLCVLLGIFSPYLPEIGKDDNKPGPPTPVVVSDIWQGTKQSLLLKQVGYEETAKAVLAKQFKSDYELQQALEKVKELAEDKGFEGMRIRTEAALKDLSVTNDTDLQAIADYLKTLAKEYGEAASE